MSLGLMMMLCMIPTPRLLTGRAHMDLHHDRIAGGDGQTKNPCCFHNETQFSTEKFAWHKKLTNVSGRQTLVRGGSRGFLWFHTF